MEKSYDASILGIRKLARIHMFAYHAKKADRCPVQWAADVKKSINKHGYIKARLFSPPKKNTMVEKGCSERVKGLMYKDVTRPREVVQTKVYKRSSDIKKTILSWKNRQLKESPPVFVKLKEYDVLLGGMCGS